MSDFAAGVVDELIDAIARDPRLLRVIELAAAWRRKIQERPALHIPPEDYARHWELEGPR